MSSNRIVVFREFPPIPVRAYDWCAHYSDTDECGPFGYGATPQAAVADLVDNYEEPR